MSESDNKSEKPILEKLFDRIPDRSVMSDLGDANFRRKLIISIKFVALCVVVLAAGITIFQSVFFKKEESSVDINNETNSWFSDASDDSDCNVLGLNLHDDLLTSVDDDGTVEGPTSSENLVTAIANADADENIKAILLEVNSFGGTPVAGEEVMRALRDAKKPTVAMIRDAGDSAAYFAATGADIIFASEISDVGSIGVTQSYLDYSERNKQEGLNFIAINAGKFKDTGNPDKTLTPEEIQLLLRDTNLIHKYFIEQVAANRKLSIEKVTTLADRSTMLGKMALENGLIDRIGGFAEVGTYLSEVIGSDQELTICW